MFKFVDKCLKKSTLKLKLCVLLELYEIAPFTGDPCTKCIISVLLYSNNKPTVKLRLVHRY